MKPLFILLSISLMGCTITKRHFGRGYQVEWKKSFSKTDKEADKQKPADSQDSIILNSYEAIAEGVTPKDSVQISKVNSFDIQTRIAPEEQINIPKTQSEIKTKQFQIDTEHTDIDVPIEQTKRKVEPFTWIALGSLVLAGIFPLFIVYIPTIATFFALAHGLLFIISSTASVIHISRNPDRYKFKGLSWTLFGLSIVVAGLALYIIIHKTITFFF